MMSYVLCISLSGMQDHQEKYLCVDFHKISNSRIYLIDPIVIMTFFCCFCARTPFSSRYWTKLWIKAKACTNHYFSIIVNLLRNQKTLPLPWYCMVSSLSLIWWYSHCHLFRFNYFRIFVNQIILFYIENVQLLSV